MKTFYGSGLDDNGEYKEPDFYNDIDEFFIECINNQNYGECDNYHNEIYCYSEFNDIKILKEKEKLSEYLKQNKQVIYVENFDNKTILNIIKNKNDNIIYVIDEYQEFEPIIYCKRLYNDYINKNYFEICNNGYTTTYKDIP